MLSMDPNEYVGRREDGIWEVELEGLLKTLREADRLEFLLRVLVLQQERGLTTKRWLKLAGTVLTERESFERIIRTGLMVTDASTIRAWLQLVSSHIGCRRLVRILKEEEMSHPREVALTHYWLRSLARSPEEQRVVDDYLRHRLKIMEPDDHGNRMETKV